MADVEFSKSGNNYYVEIKNKTLLSATIELEANWDNDPNGFGDAVGKIVVTGVDGKKKEIFTPGDSGSKSVKFPISSALGTLYPLTFDTTIDAVVDTDKPKRLRIYHPLLSEKTAKDETFITQVGDEWGIKIPTGLLEGSSVDLYMERNDSSDYGRALNAVETPSYNGNNRMSFNNKDKDDETENVPVKSSYATFYPFDFEGTQKDPKFDIEKNQLNFFDNDGSDVNAFLKIEKKTVVVGKTKVEGATLNIKIIDPVYSGSTTTEPDTQDPPDPPAGCGVDPPVITKQGGSWGVAIPPGVLGNSDEPSTITLNFQKDDNPSTNGTAISTFTVTGSNDSEKTTTLDKSKTKASKSVTFKVKSSKKTFYPFTNMDNINEPVYSEDRNRLEFRDEDGVDPNAWIEITSYSFTCDVTGTIVDPGDCNPGPWMDGDSVYEASSYIEPTDPPIISSEGGLQCRKDTDKRVILDLKNYANKLVSFQLSYRVDAAWAQKFEFNIPNCSDLYIDGGRYGENGNEYKIPKYTRQEAGNVTITFDFHNVDGGHEYLFTHNHVQGPEPSRATYEKQCTESETEITLEDGSTGTQINTVCECIETGTETWSEAGFSWPRFSGGVYVTKTGGNSVSWIYEDGGGTQQSTGYPDDVFVTITLKKVRDTVPYTGAISMEEEMEKIVWFDSDSAQSSSNLGGKDGFSLADYYEHSDKIRIRVPAEKRSLTNLQLNGADMSEFRGAGAAPFEAF